MEPRYPIFVPSKGRPNCMTSRGLHRSGTHHTIVVEAQDEDAYREQCPWADILVLPFSNRGSVIPARNLTREYSRHVLGTRRHWQLDDNMWSFYQRVKATRIPCDAGVALSVCEDFTEKYLNVPVSGLNYTSFVAESITIAPFFRNSKVYSCSLIDNEMPYRWRNQYNEDTDLCLQVLAGGECTLVLNAFLVDKQMTMVSSGGNTDELYGSAYDGRLRMARSLERDWPGVAETVRKFGRPQHKVKDNWGRFDTELIPNPDWVQPDYSRIQMRDSGAKSGRLKRRLGMEES